RSNKEIGQARELFIEYAAWVGVDLSFQDFERELAGLPGAYAPPRGRLLLAFDEGQLAGCGALRPLEESIAELKRMFVRPPFRGRGLGRVLAGELLDVAAAIGYQRVRLDTMEAMHEAIALYRSLGFKEIQPYCYSPLPGAIFMELALR
ncbi:MAG TPA: GNAT family N-acetyltransferase, partial [Myxococcaceae bacterium]|nr:GNAT family N-acetyltransferase [Myxococcaceae bacterium]